MADREVIPGWTISTWDGAFEPMAFGPHNISVDYNDDDTISIDHEVPTYPSGTCNERVTVPIRWLTEYIAEVLAYRAKKEGGKDG